MNRPAAILVALFLAGCSAHPAPAGAQQPVPEAPPRVVQVTGHASVFRAPDRAMVALAVESTGRTAREAMDQNARAMRAVIDSLRRLGIPEARIQTRRVGLSPRYDQRPQAEEPRITGYQATNQVSVRVDDLDKLGPVIDAAVAAGANRVDGIQFEVSDAETAYREALRAAIAQAQTEARAIADALGETLGPALDVSTSGFNPPSAPVPLFRARAMAAEAAVPVQAGEVEIQASVSIRFRLGT